MKHQDFVRVAEETLDSLPEEFPIQNVAIPGRGFSSAAIDSSPRTAKAAASTNFHCVPATKKSVLDLSVGPAHIVLAVFSNDEEVRHQIWQTLIHELCHYFGVTEEQLKDVWR